MRAISILGSTGSIGRSTLGVVDAFPDELRVVGLAAGANVELLAEQIAKYRPELVSVRGEDDAHKLRALLSDAPEIVPGIEGACAVASMASADAVIAAIVGAAGIPPVYAALRKGKRVGIANKEVLVAAGDVMTRTARECGGEILPVDSEHNAVHQAIRCGTHPELQRIILTASGGPFLHRDLATFDAITIDAALAHPTWRMGNKISIDSATMMNKGLEVIEAHHLFDQPADRIDIVIHPQSIVHSMVEYVDGSIIAQLSTTDMKFPIQYALLYPERVAAPFARLDFAKIRTLEFLPVDPRRFPAVELAYAACRAGGSMPAVLNAANEIAVERFLAGELPFTSIVDIVKRVLDRHAGDVHPIASVDDALAWDRWARNEARGIDVAVRR
ncbi:MAG: 1-deoxy-D-xylulose-5-phosphate reductoisomerase [Acidobacteria bacterium]|nr:1-deoxy-D-xylulose-5-phosphate reductoisomerase [Acidobacteriota bacterium]MBV9476513.1 1-deoxy-D-xylulose-5-phosphate reductoisomerase [Acidobacteriota bacterium]